MGEADSKASEGRVCVCRLGLLQCSRSGACACLLGASRTHVCVGVGGLMTHRFNVLRSQLVGHSHTAHSSAPTGLSVGLAGRSAGGAAAG